MIRLPLAADNLPAMTELVGSRIRCAAWAAAPLAALLSCTSARAQTGPGLLLEPFPKEQLIDASAGHLMLDDGHFKKSDQGVRLNFYESTGRVRVIPGSLISPRVGWDLEVIDVDLGSGPVAAEDVPGQLTDHSIGVAFPVAKVQDWIFGVSLGVGYAGEDPWSDGSGWYGKATAVAFRQFSNRDAVVFVLDYDGNRSFLPDTPLPGIAYTRKVDDTLTFILGLPLSSVTWKPLPKLSLEAGYLPIETFDAAAGYEIAPHWVVFGNLEYRSSAFQLDALGGNDRLIFEQRRAEAGVRWGPREARETFAVTAAVGYAWGQEFAVGFDGRETDLIDDLSDEPYVRFGIELKF